MINGSHSGRRPWDNQFRSGQAGMTYIFYDTETTCPYSKL